MQEYISKQQQILRPAEQIYAVISRFDNLTPAVADKVEEWQATDYSGGRLQFAEQTSLVASNGVIHTYLLDTIRKYNG